MGSCGQSLPFPLDGGTAADNNWDLKTSRAYMPSFREGSERARMRGLSREVIRISNTYASFLDVGTQPRLPLGGNASGVPTPMSHRGVFGLETRRDGGWRGLM